jgi:hypothetical protein
MALCHASCVNAEESCEQSVPMLLDLQFTVNMGLEDLAMYQWRTYLKSQTTMEAMENYWQ